MSGLISVLMPAYNSAPYIGRTLESVLAQSYKNFEVIVIDDGSTDGTYEVAKKYESKSIKVVQQENIGQSATENKAYSLSQGDYIEFLDADDLLSPDKFERQVRMLEESPEGRVATCAWARFYEDPKEADFSPKTNWGDFHPVDWLIVTWENNLMMHGATWLIPRGICEKAGPWNEELSLINDFDYFPRVLLASSGIKFCAEAKTYYRTFTKSAASNLSSRKTEAAYESAFKALSLGTRSLIEAEDSTRTRKACAHVFQQFIYSTYPSAPFLLEQAEMKVQEFGGSESEPLGGTKFKICAKLFGWKFAKRLQALVS